VKNHIVVGASGFLGRRVLRALLQADSDAVVHVLVNPRERAELASSTAEWPEAERILALTGDLTAADFGMDIDPPKVRNIVHIGPAHRAGRGNTDAHAADTAAVIALAQRCGAMLHHVSSVAVAGDHRGSFDETDLDLGQSFPTRTHRAFFAAEQQIRTSPGLAWRIYRPGIVIGDSESGEIDKVDGPYSFFTALSRLAQLPSPMPIALPNIGSTNIVPVDYVARAVAALVSADGRSKQTFHLVNPKPQPLHEVYAAFATAAGAPSAVVPVPGVRAPLARMGAVPGVRAIRDFTMARFGIPSAAIDRVLVDARLGSTFTRSALRFDRSITVPELSTYAGKIWRYWADDLDPARLRRVSGPDGFRGRVVLMTGASSGIGLASSHALARRGATVLMVARGAEDLDAAVAAIRADGGDSHGYVCDITDPEAVAMLVKNVLNDHGRVDYLVNNAGRSIRRSVISSTERMHDFERTMAVNYFGAVRLVLALLPSMRERGFGHVVNISSIGVQTKAPLFSAYVASKSALDAFATIAAAENLDAGITFTSIRMPLVRTPMIAPTAAYSSLPVDSPESAAERVVRALVDRPDRIDTPVGTVADYVGLLAPDLKRFVLHQVYKAFPESSAAKGSGDKAPVVKEQTRTEAKSVTQTLLAPLMALPTPGVGFTRRVPGLYW
jgi:NAD(P)-dependent dehydrogenase (short-subunit alcohol dehydrogenase family)